MSHAREEDHPSFFLEGAGVMIQFMHVRCNRMRGGGNVLNRGSIMSTTVISPRDENAGCVAGDRAEGEHGGAGDAGLGGGGVAWV